MTEPFGSPDAFFQTESLQAHSIRAKALKRTLHDKDKLKNKADFDFVKEHSLRYSNRYFVLLLVRDNLPDNTMRCGIICSRKFDKRAVVRNRARRIIWEAFRLLKQRILPCRMIVIPRRGICTAKMNEVMLQLQTLLEKESLMDTSRKSVSV